MRPLDVTIVGAGMIVHDQLLPAFYQLRRQGLVGEITVCARSSRGIRTLLDSPTLRAAFPDQQFRPVPHPESDPADVDEQRYLDVLKRARPRNLVVVAVPDHLHRDVVLAALHHNQHVICVKPLVLRVEHSFEIEREARARNLFVGIDYHKRFDERNLAARLRYRQGFFGELRLASARLFEKWFYRHSNFQTWCTVDNTDVFSYVGCHYVDLVAFITGLLPVAVSVYALRDRYPNGNEGYLWTDARIIWDNGACLNVQNGFAVPDAAPGANAQGLTLYCSTPARGGWLEHSDQFRGVRHCYVQSPGGPAPTLYVEPNPDFFHYVDTGGPGLTPTGYGFRSIEALVRAAIDVESAPETERAARLEAIDRRGLLATPANSRYNDLVIEAARLSIAHEGRAVRIRYAPHPQVQLES